MGDYFMELHHTRDALEPDLKEVDPRKTGGPFQVPFEAFIPEKVDGLVFAEKTLSESRLVNGVTRLQPITMLTGQAAGAIASFSARKGIEPRKVNPIDAQTALLDAGSTLIQRWYVDGPWGTQVWRDSQILSLYGILDRPGPLNEREGALREKWTWSPDQPVSSQEVAQALNALRQSAGLVPGAVAAASDTSTMNKTTIAQLLNSANSNWGHLIQTATTADASSITRREFSAVCARILCGKIGFAGATKGEPRDDHSH